MKGDINKHIKAGLPGLCIPQLVTVTEVVAGSLLYHRYNDFLSLFYSVCAYCSQRVTFDWPFIAGRLQMLSATEVFSWPPTCPTFIVIQSSRLLHLLYFCKQIGRLYLTQSTPHWYPRSTSPLLQPAPALFVESSGLAHESHMTL